MSSARGAARFGTIPAQFKALLDSTGALWMNGALVGKGMAIFTGSGTQGGGLESTVLFSLPVFTHHGMVFIPTGYSFGERLFGVETPRAGTAYVRRAGRGGGGGAAGTARGGHEKGRAGGAAVSWDHVPLAPPPEHTLASLPSQGASTFAGPDGSRQPIELELDYAKYQVRAIDDVRLAAGAA